MCERHRGGCGKGRACESFGQLQGPLFKRNGYLRRRPGLADDLSGFYNVTRMGNVTAPGNTPMMWHVDLCGTGCAQFRDEYGVT